MSKIRVYVKPEQIGGVIWITDREVIHKIAKVLRLRGGKNIYVFDGAGREYEYTIEQIDKKSLVVRKIKLLINSPLPKRRIILAFPITKEERVDFILQKATELGAAEFIPFTCQRSQRIQISASKLARWRKIIIEAARQSYRLWLPTVKNVTDFSRVCASNYKVKLAGSIEGKTIEELYDKKWQEILIVVGPEGDFSSQEYKRLAENNFKFIKLSPNLLRVETAAVFSVGLVNYFLNEG